MRMLVCLLLTSAAFAAQVRIARVENRWTVLRDGAPYFVKGAVVIGDEKMLDELKRSGGNSARVSGRLLDALARRGLTGFVNLPIGKTRHGFDYNDPKQVTKLEEDIRVAVTRYKGHPALLLWTLGNEPNIGGTREQARRTYKELERLTRVVKQIDPNHPVITVIGDGEMRSYLRDLDELCPSLDAIGLNAYHSIFFIKSEVAARGWKRPYLITEFGPTGHWQAVRSPWGTPLEETSTEKAAHYKAAYESVVLDNPQCLGSYVFLWHGDRHEKTHTWYNMFLPDGSRTGPVDAIEQLWTGKRPTNLAPDIFALQIGGRFQPPVLKPGTEVACDVAARDRDGDLLQYTWELRPDVADDPTVGGDREESVLPLSDAVARVDGPSAVLRLPAKPGKYRLFVYARDGKGSAATANRPIRVE